MKGITLFYYFLSFVAITGALFLLHTDNKLYGILSFLCIIIALSGIYFLQGASFIAVIQVVLHAGSILFWLICSAWFQDKKEDKWRDSKKVYIWLMLGAFSASTATLWLHAIPTNISTMDHETQYLISHVQRIGLEIVGTYGIAFELVGMMLLLALTVVLGNVIHTKN